MHLLTRKSTSSILILIFFLASIWSLTFYASNMLREDMERVLGEQQFSTASFAAAEVEQELNSRLRSLETIAGKITPAMMGNVPALQLFLEQHNIFQKLFNTGTFITGADGKAIVNTHATISRVGSDYSDRDYIISALKDGRSAIGRPVIGKHQKAPVFSMSAPIRDTQGLVIGALVGVTNLGDTNFLDRITNNNYGKTGGYLVVDAQHRLIVTGTDKRRIMEPSPQKGRFPLIDRFLEGYEGAGVGVNPVGVEVLSSAKRIPVAGWYVSVALPTAEAFAPIKSMHRRLVLAAFLSSILACCVGWWIIRSQRITEALELQVKERSNELQQSEEKHRRLLEESSDAIFSLSDDGRYTYANQAFASNVGKSTEYITGRTLWDVFPQEEADKRFTALNRVLSSGKMESLEVCIPGPDGDRHYLTTITPVLDSQGKALSAICSAKDVTQIKQKEQALQVATNTLEEQKSELLRLNETLELHVNERTAELQEINTRFLQLARHSRTVVWEVNHEGLYTYISEMSKAVYGLNPEDVVGRLHFYDMLPEEERKTITETAFEVFQRREPFLDFEHGSVRDDSGQQIRIATNGFPILDANGTLLGYRGADTDITEQSKLKEQLAQSQKMEAVGQLAGGLAHDFNNVLSIINGYCYLLQMEEGQNDRLTDYLEKILGASERAGELTRSMLAFSRTQVVIRETQDLNRIVAKVGTFVEKIIGEHIRFSTVTGAAALTVNADGGQIEQILINLVNNARDAMPDGGELTITTNAMQMDQAYIADHGFGVPGEYAVITVSDTGCGMDAATMEKIFEPFYTTKAVDKGTGLGLAMVYGIVKQHNGFIDVSSRLGHGASFRILLPVVGQHAVEGEEDAADFSKAPSGSETILVAEDSADLRDFANKVLTMLGYSVITAADGQEAVDRYRENADSIRLVIMDVVMPLKSGKAAFDEIRLIDPNARVLFCSGYSADIIRQSDLGDNAGFMSKPVVPSELLTRVREMLDR